MHAKILMNYYFSILSKITEKKALSGTCSICASTVTMFLEILVCIPNLF